MTAATFLSMAAFSLAASISPGPVNIVALASGIRYGFPASIAYVTGATVGFTLLLVLLGLGLHELLDRVPHLTMFVRWGGVLFLLYMAFRLAIDSGEVGTADGQRAPSAWDGALMQWLNPKAWLAAIAGMGAYAAGGTAGSVMVFAVIYFVICYISIGSWAYVGAVLHGRARSPGRMRLVNRAMSALLVASAVYLMLSPG